MSESVPESSVSVDGDLNSIADSNNNFSNPTPTRTLLRELITQRDALEIEADVIASQLRAPGVNGEAPIGINTPLVDREGFPRGDINIYEAKTKRQRLNIINTDHKELMTKIEILMLQLHKESKLPLFGQAENARKETDKLNAQHAVAENDIYSLVIIDSSQVMGDDRAIPKNIKQYQIIAVIDEILVGSPSHAAGLLNNDYLVSFGGVFHINSRLAEATGDIKSAKLMFCSANTSNECLSRIPSVVKQFHLNGRYIPVGAITSAAAALDHIPVIICREVDGTLCYRCMELKPAVWGGRGLLGCHLTPLK